MTKATMYPGADKTARWKGDGNATLSVINKIVLHTTESSALPSYSGNWPNLTYDPKSRKWFQHTPINGSATALKNSGSNQTNRANVVQVEIIGFAHNSQALPQTAIDDLGKFVAWMNTEWGVPLVAMPVWTGPNTTARMSWSQFIAFQGIMGHQHAPGNVHWDPGMINAAGIIAAAKKVLEPPKPPTPEPTPGGYYRVVAGDTYIGIAKKLGIAKWEDLQAANPAVPPSGLKVGMLLRLPTAPKPPAPPKPPVVKFKEVPFWITQFNILKPSFAGKADLPWVKRLPLIVKQLKESKSSILILNECGADEAADIANELGPQWTWDRLVNNVVMRDKEKWLEVKLIEAYLSGPTYGNRRTLVGVKLRHYQNPGLILTVGSTHLETLGSGWAKTEKEAQALRDAQTGQAVKALGSVTLTIWGGDLNDGDITSGPVAIAKKAGYKLVDELVKVSGPTHSIDGSTKVIDRLFVSPDIKVTEAHRTDPGPASDHLLTTARVVALLPI